MNDPYSILGVSQTASDSEIKKAYKELVRKYHPDNYNNNPLADLAQEKMKEINEAYDTITKSRSSGNNSGAYSGARGSYNTGGAYTRSTGGSAEFNQIRTAINAGNLAQAEQLLNASANRNAEWNFLMGSLYYRKGWLDEANRYFQTAVAMEPSNQEYAQALDYMSRGGQAYNPYGYNTARGVGGCSVCDICTAMICADMCCQC